MRKFVLLIESDDLVRRALLRLLKNHRVMSAPDLDEAGWLWCDHNFDLVLSAAQLIDGCGIEFIENSRLPGVIVTRAPLEVEAPLGVVVVDKMSLGDLEAAFEKTG